MENIQLQSFTHASDKELILTISKYVFPQLKTTIEESKISKKSVLSDKAGGKASKFAVCWTIQTHKKISTGIK